ncbi:MAG: M20 aminoacylase family protein [Flavobacteriaceae bacterium]
MPIVNRFAEFHDEIAAWRRDLHAHPELLFDVHRTAAFVKEKLAGFGVDEIVEGLGRTGVVGVIRGRGDTSGRVVGLRADMDALPIRELRDLPHKSAVDGLMHACGHDGHTAMLLGAAKYLAESRNFDGTAVVIFQPAEEGGGGAGVMVEDGLMERFGIQQVFGMHNRPGLPVGRFALRAGAQMASVDFFTIDIEGKGGHAARPHLCVDPAIVVGQLIQGFQTVVSRSADPVESLVVSVTRIDMGTADNVIAQSARMGGTVRSLTPAMRDLAEARMNAICEHVGLANGAQVSFDYRRLYPVMANHAGEATFSASVARGIVGEGNVDDDVAPVMGGEDFAFMLEARPGALIFIGQGDTAALHHPEYDFNDEIIPLGCSYWVRLVETAMPAEPREGAGE